MSQIPRPLHSGLDEHVAAASMLRNTLVQSQESTQTPNFKVSKHLYLATPALLHTFLPSPLSAPIMPGHARHDTALIHGLSATEVQTLSEACIEAKSKAYCKFNLSKISQQLPGH